MYASSLDAIKMKYLIWARCSKNNSAHIIKHVGFCFALRIVAHIYYNAIAITYPIQNGQIHLHFEHFVNVSVSQCKSVAGG